MAGSVVSMIRKRDHDQPGSTGEVFAFLRKNPCDGLDGHSSSLDTMRAMPIAGAAQYLPLCKSDNPFSDGIWIRLEPRRFARLASFGHLRLSFRRYFFEPVKPRGHNSVSMGAHF